MIQQAEPHDTYSWYAQEESSSWLLFKFKQCRFEGLNSSLVHPSLQLPHITVLIIELYVSCTLVKYGDCLYPVTRTAQLQISQNILSTAPQFFLPASLEHYQIKHSPFSCNNWTLRKIFIASPGFDVYCSNATSKVFTASKIDFQIQRSCFPSWTHFLAWLSMVSDHRYVNVLSFNAFDIPELSFWRGPNFYILYAILNTSS